MYDRCMALENISKLFSNRTITVTPADVSYGIERFLQSALRSERIQCCMGGKTAVTIRVGSPALAQMVLVYEHDIRLFALRELGYTIDDICVLL